MEMGAGRNTINKSESKMSSLISRDFLDSCILKFVLYSVYSAFGSTLTYLPLYFKQMGLDAAQVGILIGIRPVFHLVGPPLSGFVADKYKKRKFVAIVGVLFFMGKYLAVLLVGHAKQTCLNTVNNVTQIASNTTSIQADSSRYFAEHLDAAQSINTTHHYNVNTSHGLAEKRDRWKNNYVIVTSRSEARRIFIEVLLVTIICEPFGSFMMSILDGTIVDYLGDNRNDYGKYRLWGSVGIGTSALLVGTVIQHNMYYFCETPQHQYSILFYFMFGFGCFSLVLLIFSKQVYSDGREQHESGISKLKTLFCSIKSASFWIALISLALLDGFQMDFGPWFLDDLDTSSMMIGIATACHFAVNVFTYLVSPFIINKLGYMPVLSMGLFIHVVLFVVLSFAKSSWFGVILFALAGFVPSLSTSCGAAYVGMVSAPLGIVTTAEGFLNGIYSGIGISLGTIVGGAIIKAIGIRMAFRALAGFSLLALIVFNIMLYINEKLNTQTDSSYEPLKMSSNDDADDP